MRGSTHAQTLIQDATAGVLIVLSVIMAYLDSPGCALYAFVLSAVFAFESKDTQLSKWRG